MPNTPLTAASVAFACITLLLAAHLGAADPAPQEVRMFTQILTSTHQNHYVESWKVSSREITPDCPTAWTIQKEQLHGGKQEGVDVIIVDNGKLQIRIIPTRGMSLFSVTSGDQRLGWDSPVHEIVNPRNINLQSRGGLGWLEGFNEFLVRCGLESNGHPGTDKFINNVGDEATMDLTLHGKIGNIPAQEVEVSVERQPPYRIRVRGRVDERAFYGPKLELWTTLSTEPGSSAFRIEDTITNHGADTQEFELLYHTNFGRPLLEEGATFVAPIERLTPFNANAAKGLKEFAMYNAPTLGFIEQVYCMRLLTGSGGQTMVMLQSRQKDRGVSMAFSTEQLPFFTLWKNTAAANDGYVTGLEPGTNFPHNRRIERKAGRVPKLAAGASRSFAIDFAIHVGAEQVKQTADRIAAIQGSRKTAVDEAPEKAE